MEMINTGIELDSDTGSVPESMTKAKTIEFLKESNDFAIEKLKKSFKNKIANKDPMLLPVVVSSLAHDYLLKHHSVQEEDFKGALIKHKIYQDQEVAVYMQAKQFELLSLAGPSISNMGYGGMPEPTGSKF
jgi:hypothetical protein